MRKVALVLFCVAILAAPGCYSMTHNVGKGAQSQQVVAAGRQWFALWGLIPFAKKDGGKLAGGAQDYTINTKQNVVDVIINMFTGIVGFHTRTVTVIK